MAFTPVPKKSSKGLNALTPDNHYWLFCKMLELGFALHTGPTERLILNYKIQETQASQQLPKIKSSAAQSFRLSNRLITPSEYYLYYNPEENMGVPELARYQASNNQFIPCGEAVLKMMNHPGEKLVVPVVRLAALRGLHHIKDVVCLQISQINFDPLFEVNPVLADKLLQQLNSKLKHFLSVCAYWRPEGLNPGGEKPANR